MPTPKAVDHLIGQADVPQLERLLAGCRQGRRNREQKGEARGGVAAQAEEHADGDGRARTGHAGDQRNRLRAANQAGVAPAQTGFAARPGAESLGGHHRQRTNRERRGGHGGRAQALLDRRR